MNHMKLFLTSSPTGPLDGSRKVDGLDHKNQFVEKLKENWKVNSSCLMISAFPDNIEANNQMISFFEQAFNHCGLFCHFSIWDSRTKEYSKAILHSYDMIVLGGGHVPTENAYFQRIHLKELLEDYSGMVMGISAGTMNCADIVYAQPEEDGEAMNPDYQRFLPGLSLTTTNILPHYQMTKNNVLDGMRLFEDITYADSMSKEFLALVDGSYLLIEDEIETIYGESYLIKDGKCTQFSCENEIKVYKGV